MWMPRTSSLLADLSSVAAWLFDDHHEQCGVGPRCDMSFACVDWECSMQSMMIAHDTWLKLLTIMSLLPRLRHGDALIDSMSTCWVAQFVVVGMKDVDLRRFLLDTMDFYGGASIELDLEGLVRWVPNALVNVPVEQGPHFGHGHPLSAFGPFEF